MACSKGALCTTLWLCLGLGFVIQWVGLIVTWKQVNSAVGGKAEFFEVVKFFFKFGQQGWKQIIIEHALAGFLVWVLGAVLWFTGLCLACCYSCCVKREEEGCEDEENNNVVVVNQHTQDQQYYAQPAQPQYGQPQYVQPQQPQMMQPYQPESQKPYEPEVSAGLLQQPQLV